MGARGPIGQPDNVVKLRGNPGKRKPRQSAAATTPVAVPPRPAWLKGEARREWDRVTAELKKQGRIATTDRAVLVAYCTAWARFVEIEAELGDDADYTTLGSKDQVVVSAEFAVWSKLHERLIAASKELGLNVNVRLRLPAAPDKEGKDEFEEMMSARSR